MEFCRTTWFCSLVFSLWFCFVHVAMSLNCQGCVSAAAAADVSSLLPKVQTVQLFATSGALVLLIVLWIPLDPFGSALGISWENLLGESFWLEFGFSCSSHVLVVFLLSSLAHFPSGGAADGKTNRFESRVNDVFKDRPTKGRFWVCTKGQGKATYKTSDSEVVLSCLTRFG